MSEGGRSTAGFSGALRPLIVLILIVAIAVFGYYAGSVTASTRLVTPDEVNTVEVVNNAIKAVVTVTAKIAPEAVQPGDSDTFTSSGFFYRPDLIVTNYHAVTGSVVRVSVTLYDGREVPATIQNVDAGLDVAVLRVPGVKAPGLLRFGDSNSLLSGQKLIVIGAPFGKRNTVSVGSMGSLNRIDEQIADGVGEEIPQMIVTDANIQQGNSGGPLLDSRGNVVGVVDANLVNAVGSGGLLGLAIPGDLVRQSLEDLEKYNVSQRGQLGASLRDLSDLEPYTRKLAGIVSTQGAWIDEVELGGPAARAGLRPARRDRNGKLEDLGDIILKVNDRTVVDRFAVIQEVAKYRPGQIVNLRVWRNKSLVTVRVTITARTPR